MDIALFDYSLPRERIAQAPVRPRERARMLYYNREKQVIRDHKVADVPTLLQAGDLLVFNVSRVRAARVIGKRVSSGLGDVELLILKPRNNEGEFECLIRGKKITLGERFIIFASHQNSKNNQVEATVTRRLAADTGLFVIAVVGSTSQQFLDLCEQIGRLPLPPYINNPQLIGHEQELYQPIMARELGSVAAPTASLHFSKSMLGELQSRGVKTAEVVLHVGLGTFLPVRVQDTDDHSMHAEEYEIGEETIKRIHSTKQAGGRVIAVGTTVARALESTNGTFQSIETLTGETTLFIQPGYHFKVIDGLLTNFHMPKSTLLMLVSAFVGREELLKLYGHALQNHYRFLSFGDCMLLV